MLGEAPGPVNFTQMVTLFAEKMAGGTFYIYKVVISFCLFVCPIITQGLLGHFTSNFDWGTRETHGNVLSLVLRF